MWGWKYTAGAEQVTCTGEGKVLVFVPFRSLPIFICFLLFSQSGLSWLKCQAVKKGYVTLEWECLWCTSALILYWRQILNLESVTSLEVLMETGNFFPHKNVKKGVDFFVEFAFKRWVLILRIPSFTFSQSIFFDTGRGLLKFHFNPALFSVVEHGRPL